MIDIVSILNSQERVNIEVKVGEDIRPCGQIFLTDDILNIFKEIVGKEKANLVEIN